MNITRRKFLEAASLTIGGVLALKGGVAGQRMDRGGLFAIPDLTGDALSQLTWDSFLPFVNTDFTFGEGRNAVSLRLVDIKDARPTGRRYSKGQENFTLKFQGPFDRPLTDKTYQVNHFNLGDFEMFITNGGRVKRNQYYVAVFNRIVS